MNSQSRKRLFRVSDIGTGYVLLIFLSFLSGAVIFSYVLPDAIRSRLCAVLLSGGTLRAGVIYGCVFLVIAACMASVSAFGRLGIPLISASAGIYCSAISGAIMPAEPMLTKIMPAALFMLCFIFSFQLIAVRSVSLSTESCERLVADRRIKNGLISLAAMLIVFSGLILASYFIFYKSF